MSAFARGRTIPAVALLAATLVLAGCFTVESNVTINDDATADIEIVAVFDIGRLSRFTELLGEDASGLEDLSPDELFSEFTDSGDLCADFEDSYAGYEIIAEDIVDGDQVGGRCIVRGVPIEDLDDIGEESSLTITQDGPITTFNAVLEGVDELTAGSDDFIDLLGVDLDELFSITFSAEGPGSLGANNATSTNGSTATWRVTPGAPFVVGGDATMTAEWSTEGGGSSTWVPVLIVLAVLVALGLLVALLLRRNRGAETGTGTGTGPPPNVPPPPPGAPAAPPPAAPGPPMATMPPAPAVVTPPSTPPPPPPPPSSPPPPPPPSSTPPPPR
jgi:hypothetical protein